MIRRHRIATLITILGISFTPPFGFAEVLLYETGFEAPGFIAGKYLAGQSGWVAFQNANANAATVTTERSRTGTQSAKLDGAVMGPYLGRDYFDAFLFHGIGFDPIGSGNPIVEFSVDVFYIPNGGGSDARAQIEIYDSAGSFIGEVSVDTAGEVFASGSNPLLPAGTALCSIGEWNKLGATINFLDHKVGFQLNGTPFGTTTVDPQVVDIYDADLSLVVNFKRSDHVVYYDNYRITAHAAASPPVFTGMEYRPDHSVVLSLQGEPGSVCQLLSSTDLAAWSLLTTVTNSTGELRYTNDIIGGSPKSFYRALQLP